MARTPNDKPAGSRKAVPSKVARKTRAKPTPPDDADDVVPEQAAEPEASRGSKNILTAGIKALTHAHEEAVARQSRVFESLLGAARKRVGGNEGDASLASSALDPFGFKKFEDVFDQRVARTLQRIGYPTPEDITALQAEVQSLRAELARLRKTGSKR